MCTSQILISDDIPFISDTNNPIFLENQEQFKFHTSNIISLSKYLFFHINYFRIVRF